MNIAIVDLRAGLGGHTRTATTIAEGLRRNGHLVVFIVGSHQNALIPRSAGFKVFETRYDFLGRFPDLATTLERLQKSLGLEIVHTFNQRGLPTVIAASKSLGLRFLWTVCGGTAPKDFLPVRSVVSLSEEGKTGMLEQCDVLQPCDITVLPARMDIPVVRRRVQQASAERFLQFRQKYDVSPSSKIVLRIVRLSAEYEESVHQGIDAAAELTRQGHDLCFVHIGFPRSPSAVQNVREHVRDVNREMNRVVAVSAHDEALNAIEFNAMATAVLGTGRSAFEAMIAGKPTLIVGQNGFAGTVCPDEIRAIAYYNFSGRNVRVPTERSRSLAELCQCLDALLIDEQLASRLSTFGMDYVQENLSVEKAIPVYERLYENFEPSAFPDDDAIREEMRRPLKLIRERFRGSKTRIRFQSVMAQARNAVHSIFDTRFTR